jgi:hypothetical protein
MAVVECGSVMVRDGADFVRRVKAADGGDLCVSHRAADSFRRITGWNPTGPVVESILRRGVLLPGARLRVDGVFADSGDVAMDGHRWFFKAQLHGFRVLIECRRGDVVGWINVHAFHMLNALDPTSCGFYDGDSGESESDASDRGVSE